MARRPKPPAPKKRHHSERFRFPGAHIERWTNAKAAHCGFNLGMARNSVEVAEILGDGTSPETLRRMIKLWQLPVDRANRGLLVRITSHKKRKLREKADSLGIEPEEFLRRIVECVVGDDLYDAVTDGRYPTGKK
jgi:hypothetical protein